MRFGEVGFVGLGFMGAPMAARLARDTETDLAVYDVVAERSDRLRRMGAKVASSVPDLGLSAHTVLVMVHTDRQVRDVVSQLIGCMSAGSYIVVHSTCMPATCRELASEAARREIDLIDAPVSGGQQAAADGTLTLVVGGRADAVDGCRPLLRKLSSNIYRAGDVGTGQVFKLVNNAIGVTSRIVIGEALALARAAGLSNEDLVLEQITSSTGDNWHVRNWRAVQQSAERSQGGPAALAETARKDLAAALELAQSYGVSMPVVSTAVGNTAGIAGPNG